MLIGAHVGTRGGIVTAIDRAVEMGAEVMQMHPSSPQRWAPLPIDATADAFLEHYRGSGLRGLWLHAPYLINLATGNHEHIDRSVAVLTHNLELAVRLGANGLILHPGSHLGAGFETQLPAIREALGRVLGGSDAAVRLVIENSAGSGGCIGCSFEELGAIATCIDDPRLGVCLDTQHMFASGYDVRTPAAAAASLDAFAENVGFDLLVAVHANDSKRPLGSGVDRHENIGDGEIGMAGFRFLLSDPRLRTVPWILEVPGRDRNGPDAEQIARLRECAAPARSPRRKPQPMRSPGETSRSGRSRTTRSLSPS